MAKLSEFKVGDVVTRTGWQPGSKCIVVGMGTTYALLVDADTRTNDEVCALDSDGFYYLPTPTEPKKKYVIVRTYSAGVFAGYLESRTGQEVVLRQARRLWYWKGAASLSQLAMQGVSCPRECKFPCEVDRVELLQAIEILDCTDTARLSIAGVAVWKE